MTPDAWLPRRQRAPAPSLQSARSSSSPRWGWWWWWWRGWDGTWWQQGPCQRWQQDRRFPLNLESEASCESPCRQLWRRGPRRSCWRHWRVEMEVERLRWSVGAGGRTWSAQLREAATQGTRNTWEAQKIEMESIFSNSSVELKGSPHTFCWKSGGKRHFEICFMLIAYARPDKHQSYQRIIDKDITGLPQKNHNTLVFLVTRSFWKHFHSHSQISLVIHQNQQRSKLWPSWITSLGVFKDFQ